MTETQTPYKVKDGRLFHSTTGEDLGPIDEPDSAQDEEVPEERGLTVIHPANPLDLIPTQSNLPPHFKLLNLEQCPLEVAEQKVEMLTNYLGSTRDLTEYANLEIEVKGAALIFNPDYHPKGKPEGTIYPGYWNSRIMLTDGTLIESSSGKVSQMLAGLIPFQGQGDWKAPKRFKVIIRSDGHFLDPVKR